MCPKLCIDNGLGNRLLAPNDALYHKGLHSLSPNPNGPEQVGSLEL